MENQEAKVQAANLSLKNMNLQKYYNARNPSSEITKVMQSIMTLLGYKTDWYSVTRQIQSYSFKTDLTNFRKDLISQTKISALKVFVDDPEFNPDQIRETDESVANLCQWVIAVYEYAVKFQTVKSKKNELNSQTKEQNKIMEALIPQQEQLAKLNDEIAALETQHLSK